MGRFGGKARLESHDLIEVLLNAQNGDADDHLGGFAGDDEALGTGCDKRCIVRDDRGIDDLHAQACGAVGCAHDVANATQKLDDVLGKQVIEVCLRIG